MKSNVLTMIKKECARLFGDKKLVFSGIILQGLLIFLLYTLMGTWMSSIMQTDDDYKYKVSVVNMPASVTALVSGMPVEITNITASDVDAVKQKVTAEEADLLMVFPADFDAAVAAFDVATATEAAPQIQIWSNMARMQSMKIDGDMKELLGKYERSMAKKFDINAGPDVNYDLNTGADFGATLMMSMIPMIFIMVMYQGCMAIAPESIAGEKERGTLGTLLATPARRRDMALAKILSITLFGALGATVSFLGMMLSLPKMMNMDSMSFAGYSMPEYLMVFGVAISTMLVFVSVLSVISVYSKSIKEANSYAAPLLFVSVVLGMSGMFTGGAASEFYYYLIPVFNSAQSLSAIFASGASALNVAVTVGTNLIFALIFTGLLARMFSSEKIVFDK